MTPDRHQKLKDLFNRAVALRTEDREGFLASACGDDRELRREVEALIAAHQVSGSFIDSPAYAKVAGLPVDQPELTAGQAIGNYRILSLLGRGGMGEVYLAIDTKLNRKVAIKFLSTASLADRDANRRLLREARAAANLDHPNICAIHEVGEADGRAFIVMQYVEGETLDLRLKQQPPDMSEALSIAAQLAGALAEAHSHGIIHRDIKPSNIMITKRGGLKVLDFGLAKTTEEAAAGTEASSLLTESGMILGTVPYMSPEQLRAEKLDERSDIFSLGVVFYELVSGRHPFAKKSAAETISATLNYNPPPLSSTKANAPPTMDRLVDKCLNKNPSLRYQTMQELALDLAQIRLDGDQQASIREASTVRLVGSSWEGKPRQSRGPWQKRLASRVGLVLFAITLLVVLAAAYAMFLRPPKRSAQANNSMGSAAYDFYVHGKVNVTSENRESNEAAIKLLEQAVAADPNFAPAYAELARAYNIKAVYYAPDAEKKQLNENAAVAVEKSLTLEPDLAEGHFARGLILWTHANRFPHEQAIQAYHRAIELNPNLDEAHHQLGLVYAHIGLFDKGWEEIEKALAINPSNTLARFRLGVIDLYRVDYEAALKIFNSIPPEKNPSLWTFQTATALFNLGRDDEASNLLEQYLNKNPQDEGGVGTSVKAMILAKAGKERDAEEAIRRSIEIGQGFGHFHHTAYNIASAYALMNKPAPAMRWLQTAADDGFPCYPLFERDANLNNLRTDARFITFMTKLKLEWEQRQSKL